MTKINKLHRLASALDALPRQTALRQSKIQFETIREKSTTHSVTLSRSFSELRILRSVLEDPQRLRAELKAPCKSLRLVAQTLLQQVKSLHPELPKITGALDTLSKQNTVVADLVSSAWNEANKDEVNVTQALIELTARFDVASQMRLQVALNEFMSVERPSGPEVVERYRNARARLRQIRQQISLPGPVGKFLSDAIGGRGSLSELFSPEIQDFLDSHPILKARLTVTLS